MNEGNGKSGLGNLSALPIIGRKIDEKGIALAKDILAKLEKGELLSVAFVAERANGDTVMSHSHGYGQPMKLRGGLATLGTALDLAVIGITPTG